MAQRRPKRSRASRRRRDMQLELEADLDRRFISDRQELASLDVDVVFVGEGAKPGPASSYAIAHDSEKILVVEPKTPDYVTPRNVYWTHLGAVDFFSLRPADSIGKVFDQTALGFIALGSEYHTDHRRLLEKLTAGVRAGQKPNEIFPQIDPNTRQYFDVVHAALRPGGEFILHANTDYERDRVRRILTDAGFDHTHRELTDREVKRGSLVPEQVKGEIEQRRKGTTQIGEPIKAYLITATKPASI